MEKYTLNINGTKLFIVTGRGFSPKIHNPNLNYVVHPPPLTRVWKCIQSRNVVFFSEYEKSVEVQKASNP